MLPEAFELLQKSGNGKWIERFQDPSYQISVDDTVSLLDEAGIQTVFLSAWHSPKGAIIPNEVIDEYVSKYPDRFVGIASVDISHPVKACKELEYWVKERGFKGLRVIPWLWKIPPTSNLFYPLFAKCVELDIPFMTQVGHTGPLYPSEPGRPVPYIDQIALDFPDLKIVCGHIGFPWTDEMIGVAWKHKNVFIDTSAYLPRYYPKQLLHYMNTYGKKRVMFGVNSPQLSWKEAHRQAKELPLKKEVLELFLHGNARRLFGLDAKGDEKEKKRETVKKTSKL